MSTATRTDPLSFLTDQLNDLKQRGTYFKLRVLDDEQAPVCTFDGKRVINLASNNYLGLTTHPKLREAALQATKDYGVGSEIRRPLGVAIVGGLLVSQALTLYTTPVVYLYMDRFKDWVVSILPWRKKAAKEEEVPVFAD